MSTQGDFTTGDAARISVGTAVDGLLVIDEPGVTAPPEGGLPASGDRYAAVRGVYPPLLNTAQVAELLDLNPRTVLNMAGDGRLPASRLPGSRKFHFLLEDIIATLETNRVATSE